MHAAMGIVSTLQAGGRTKSEFEREEVEFRHPVSGKLFGISGTQVLYEIVISVVQR